MATKMRLYDSGKRFENYVDRYTLYFPYPKWLQKHDRAKGCYLGCSPTQSGMNMCCWDINVDSYVNSDTLRLGKKIRLDSMPIGFQKVAKQIETSWQYTLKVNTDEQWDKFNRGDYSVGN